MTINFMHLRIPHSPVTVAVSHDGDHQESWKANEQLQEKKRVCFCNEVRVYKRCEDEEEAAIPHSALHYTPSEFRQIKREIRQIRKIYDNDDTLAHNFQHLHNEHYCLRGVEHLIAAELKKRTDRRRNKVWFLVADVQEQQGLSDLELLNMDNDSISSSFSSLDFSQCSSSSSKSSFNGDVLGTILRSETKQSAIEAAQRGQEDAAAAFADYNYYSEIDNAAPATPINSPTNVSSEESPPRSILRRSPSPNDGSPLTMPFQL